MSTLLTKIATAVIKGVYALILLIFGRLFKTLPKRPEGVIFKSEAIAYEYLQRQVTKHNRRMFRLILLWLGFGVLITVFIFFN